MNKLKIGFVLSSDPIKPLPSTRVSVLQMLPYLAASGIAYEIFVAPVRPTENPPLDGVVDSMVSQKVGIAYFQKVHGSEALDCIASLKAAGIRTVYGVCDRVDEDMAEETHATIVVTDFLKSLYRKDLHQKIFVVHDGIEFPEKRKFKTDQISKTIVAALVTSSRIYRIPVISSLAKQIDIQVVGDYPSSKSLLDDFIQRARDYRMSNGGLRLSDVLYINFERIKWERRRVYSVLANADLGVIPIDMVDDPLEGREISRWQVKSENRLTLKMAMGLPVIASPVPSYLNVIEQGVNGFIAETEEDWRAAVQLLENPERRVSIGEAARATVIERFSKVEQARKLVKVLKNV